jgi:AraC family carnitine catabolism transcriptional activator
MRKLAFLVLPEFSNLGLAAAIEPLFVANWLAQQTVFEWKVVSVDGAPVRASSGSLIAVDGDLGAAAECKTVFVLASFDPHSNLREPRIGRWLKRGARFGVEIGGIENGSLVLAAAGLLNGYQVAVHWDNLIGFQEHYPKTRALPQLFCRSGERITCAGASAILDMMIAWIGWHGEADLASEVAEHLLLGTPRVAETPQRVAAAVTHAVADTVVLQAQAIMAEHVDEPLSCGQIAQRVGLSLRQIERRFRDELQCSVLQQYLQIRMAKAHQLLQQTPLSVTDVTFSCGFSSPEYFCRLYRKQFGCLPSRDRRQSTSAPVLRRPSRGITKRRAAQA